MTIFCPKCGEHCEVDSEPNVGRHIVCPFCHGKFSYSPEQRAEFQTVKPEMVMSTCPHCGFEETVESEYVGFTGTCTRCGKDYVIGGRRPSPSMRDAGRKPTGVFKGVGLPLTLIAFAVLFILPAPRRVVVEMYRNYMEERNRESLHNDYLTDRRWYDEQLRYNGLVEVKQATGWTKAGGFIVTLDDSAPGLITLDYSPKTGRVIFPSRIQSGFASDLVKVRLRIAEYERSADSNSN